VMGDETGVSFEWPLSDLRNDRLKFEIPGTGYELILQRVCDDNNSDGDVPEIRNVLMGGEWVVALYEDGEVNETQNYLGYNFAFSAEHMVSATLGETGPSFPGLWRVIRNSDGKLMVYLNLGDEDPLGELTDDWSFVSMTNGGRLELKSESGDGSVSTLVFEKK
ncbi:MAG TPA: hypothetical protein VKN36_16715, partial [Eudoraea sp.]|nr:hypothetical protein [Eudoraea sp.]